MRPSAAPRLGRFTRAVSPWLALGVWLLLFFWLLGANHFLQVSPHIIALAARGTALAETRQHNEAETCHR